MTRLSYGHLAADTAGYLPYRDLSAAWESGQARTSWWLGPQLMSADIRGAGIYKQTERLPLYAPDTLDQLEGCGIRHPASYGDCYHQLAPPEPAIRVTLNALFAGWTGRPWEEARRIGSFPGPWYRYDLRSAYRWAATLGLPEPRSYTVRRRWLTGKAGLWVCLLAPRDDLPPCHRQGGWVVLSTEEAEAYQVDPLAVRYGVTWDDCRPSDYVERTLARLPDPAAKHAGRAYWGRWAGRNPLICRTRTRVRELRNFSLHLIWAWLIVARVRLRLWQVAGPAAHVYVDEVLTPAVLPVGPSLGDWNLKATYPAGVTVHRTGWWGPRRGAPAMRTGEPREAA